MSGNYVFGCMIVNIPELLLQIVSQIGLNSINDRMNSSPHGHFLLNALKIGYSQALT